MCKIRNAAEEMGFLMCVDVNSKLKFIVLLTTLFLVCQQGVANQDLQEIHYQEIIDSIYKADQLQQDSFVDDFAKELGLETDSINFDTFVENMVQINQVSPSMNGLLRDSFEEQSATWQSKQAHSQPTMSSKKVFKVLRRAGMVSTCNRFVSDKSYGEWALYIKKAFNKYRFNYLINGTKDLVRVCPNYRNFKDSEKIDVWITIIIAMSHYESSCRPKITANGPNGPLLGLLQLHKGKEGRYSKICENGDGKSVNSTIECGLSMLDDQIRRDRQLFSQKSYWDVLRPLARSQKWRKIASSISFYPSCR